jgi:hypothetical protein
MQEDRFRFGFYLDFSDHIVYFLIESTSVIIVENH